MSVGIRVSNEPQAQVRSSSFRSSSREASPVSTDPYNINFVNGFVTTNFPGAVLLEQHQVSNIDFHT